MAGPTEIAVRGDGTLTPMGAEEVKQQVQLIQQIMKGVMKDGEHFGTIPGTQKPTLLKAGAEKLCMTFRLRAIIDPQRDIIVRDLPRNHREYQVVCHIFSGERELASGVGTCSTMEGKYRFRGGERIPTDNPVPKNYWNLKQSGELDKAQDAIGGPGFGVMKHPETKQWVIAEVGEKMENDNPADCFNTVLKMAKKRAQVDGILTATAASDIFTQDLEDMSHNEPPTGDAPKRESKPATTTPPPQGQSRTFTKPAPQTNHSPGAKAGAVFKTITEPQAKRFYAIARGAGVEGDELNRLVATRYPECVDDSGKVHLNKMQPDHYNEACAWAQRGCQDAPPEESQESSGRGESPSTDDGNAVTLERLWKRADEPTRLTVKSQVGAADTSLKAFVNLPDEDRELAAQLFERHFAKQRK